MKSGVYFNVLGVLLGAIVSIGSTSCDKDATEKCEIKLNRQELTIEANSSETLIASVTPAEYAKDLEWNSSDPTIAEVDNNGKVTGVSAGTADIIVTIPRNDAMPAICKVTVTEYVAASEIIVDPAKLEMKTGTSHTLQVTLVPENATNKNVAFASDNESVVTVSEVGEVTAVGEGEAAVTITAEDGGLQVVCPVTVRGYDIYVAGYCSDFRMEKACYWINGSRIDLSDENSKAHTLAMLGTDVYVGGEVNQKPVIWKNGAMTLLEDSFAQSMVYDISVSGSDILACGKCCDESFNVTPRVWRNNEMLYNEPDKSTFYSLAFSGEDIYTAGITMNSVYTPVATVWKNGQVLYMEEPENDYWASESRDIVIANTNIYATGSISEVVDGYTKTSAVVWKNGKILYKSDSSNDTLAFSIAVDGDDVYYAGEESSGGMSMGRIWKNGAVLYEYPGESSSVSDIEIVNGEIFATGYISENWIYIPKVWQGNTEIGTLDIPANASYMGTKIMIIP